MSLTENSLSTATMARFALISCVLSILFIGFAASAQEAPTPTCPAGYELSGNECVHTTPVAPTCPEGYTQEGENCVPTSEPIAPNTCPEGYTLGEGGCASEPVEPTCSEGLRLQEDVYSEGEDGCISEEPAAPDACSGGSVLSNGQCVVIMGTPTDGVCSPIPPTVIRTINGIDRCVAIPPSPAEEPACAEGLVMNGGECYEVEHLSCDTGFAYDDESNTCQQEVLLAPTCPTGTTGPVENLCTYVTIAAAVCPVGFTLIENQCVGNPVAPTCPAGYTLTDSVCVANPVTPTSSGSSNSGGGGGGGGSSSTPIVALATTTPQVLGAATSCFQFTSDLTIGMTSTDVTELQKILIAKGHLKIATPTGYFGAMTQAAVKAFQAANSLEQTGVVDEKTRALLNVCPVGVTNPNAALILELYKKLAVLLEQIKALKAAQGVL